MNASGSMDNFLAADLYGITSSSHSRGRTNLDVVRQMITAGIKVIQYREKEKPIREMYAECQAVRDLTRQAGVTFIVNDRVDLAMAVDADGIHIGQTDLPPQIVRQLIGNNKILGLSTHSMAEIQAAAASGIADYIGVGPVFSTDTKKDASSPVGLHLVRYAAEYSKLPFVVIGGIKTANIVQVKCAGASVFAIISEIVSAEDIPVAVASLRRQLAIDNVNIQVD